MPKYHWFTKEEEKFIFKNYYLMEYKELLEKFNKKFNTNIGLVSLMSKANRILNESNSDFKWNKRIKFTKEMDIFIVENYKTTTRKDLCIKFEQKFGTPISDGMMKERLHKLSSEYDVIKKKNHTYTEEQDEWLRQNVDNYDYIALSKLFSEKFNVKVADDSIRVRCNKLKINRLSCYEKKNFVPSNLVPIGHERVVNGYVWVKVKDTEKNTIKNWQRKQRYIWEQHYGKEVPKGHRIMFLDGNNRNFDINNLVCVDDVSLGAMTSLLDCSTKIKKVKLASLKLNKVLSELSYE